MIRATRKPTDIRYDRESFAYPEYTKAMPEKNAMAIDAKPALAIMIRDLRWMNVAVTSTRSARMNRTTATTTWSISAGEPPVKTTANGLGSVDVEKVTNRLANMPSKNWTINKGIIIRDNISICPSLIRELEEAIF